MNLSQYMRSREPTIHESGLLSSLVITIIITMGLTQNVHAADIQYSSAATSSESLTGTFILHTDTFTVTDVNIDDSSFSFLSILISYDSMSLTAGVGPSDYNVIISQGGDHVSLTYFQGINVVPGTVGVLQLLGQTVGGVDAGLFDGAGVQSSGTFFGTDVTPVPLPAATWLFISALGGLVVVKRKRQ